MFLELCGPLKRNGDSGRAELQLSEYVINRMSELCSEYIPEYIAIEGITQISCRLTAQIINAQNRIIPSQLKNVHFYRRLRRNCNYILIAKHEGSLIYNRVIAHIEDEHSEKYVEGIVLTIPTDET